MKKEKIGKYLITFMPEGCAPKNFKPYSITRSFFKEGEFDAFIDEMNERGYIFEDAWTWDEYERRKAEFLN